MTLFTSATKNTIKGYLGITAFVLVFGLIYEKFSHQVYSPFMYLAFLIPLGGGIIELLITSIEKNVRRNRPTLSRQIYRGGLAYLTVGSILQGVLEIYGTTNYLTSVYGLVGLALVGIGLAGTLISVIR